jgi:hypothetical protein
MRIRNAAIVLAAIAGAAVFAPGSAVADPPAASVHIKVCLTGSDPADRSATFVGRIHSVPGSVRLAMHFKLLETSRDGSAQSSDLGPWHTSREGVDKFTYSQIVNGMAPGDSYRVVVRFRWFDGSGGIIKRAKHTSAACTQPGLPNLTISGIGIAPGNTSDTAMYRVHVANDGEGPADRVVVRLYSDGYLVDSRKIKHLPRGTTRTVKISGPVCQKGHTVRAVVDPANRIEESDENDNSFTRTC